MKNIGKKKRKQKNVAKRGGYKIVAKGVYDFFYIVYNPVVISRY